MTILVIAEHNNQTLSKGTLSTVTAAQKIGGDIHLLVMGSGAQSAADHAAKITGVTTVHHADSDVLKVPLAESYATVVLSVADQFQAILAPASTFGKNILPRVAAKLDIQQISDVIAVEEPKTFKRPIYAGNVIATVETSDEKLVMTVRPTAFDPAKEGGSAMINTITDVPAQDLSQFVSMQASEGDRPDLSGASIVVSGGRGVGSAENFKIIEALADKLGAAVGASRAAVDAGYVPNDYQVGQTGKIVAPDLYIAVGISGAIQHLAGMKESKVIVAINTDEDAPIFQVADYGLVADLFEAVPELEKAL